MRIAAAGAALATFATFATIAAGGVGCVIRGLIADRLRRTTLAIGVMAISGTCAVAVGFLFGGTPALLVTISLIWGFSIVADSAQFPASRRSFPHPL